MNALPLPSVEDLYDSAPCGHLLLDTSGRVLDANSTFCGWIGTDRDELCGKAALEDLFTAGGRIFFHTHLLPLLRLQASVSEVKLEVRVRGGARLPMIFNIAEREWKDTRLWQAAVFIAEDRDKYERELLLQRQRAETLARQHAEDQEKLKDRAKFAEQLVGMVSHDIRNPLSVIHMSVALLERGVGADQQRLIVGRISRAVTRVRHLIEDLLDFTQARLGRGIKVHPREIDLHQAVGEAVAELQVAFPGREIRHEASGGARILADPERIAQAVGNLVANAANHGSPVLPVTVRTQVSGSSAEVAVHNFGRPIPEALLPVLFEPMVRGAEGGGAPQGVGLGLYIVREIARSHGGSVQVRSTEQDGTEFVIGLPATAPTQ